MDQELQKRIQAARARGVPEDQIQRFVLMDRQRGLVKSPQTQQVAQKTLLQKAADADVFGIKLIPAATGTLGAVGGFAVGGPVGAVAGGAAGAALGEGFRQSIDTKEGYQPMEILEEGIYGGAGELGGQVLGRLGGKVLKPVAKKVIGGAAKFAGVEAPKVTSKIAGGFLKETPSQWLKAAEGGLDLNELFFKIVPKYGSTIDEMLGPVTKGKAFGHSGTLQTGIKTAEDEIRRVAQQAGKNVRISGDDLLAGLLREKKIMSRQLGSSARVEAMDKIIKQVQTLYKKGITVNQAVDILHEANQKFGASILEEGADAIATAAQKMQGNIIRNQLRTMFPAIGAALDTQQELIVAREMFKTLASKANTGGFKLGRLDLSRPGTIFDALASSGIMAKGTARLRDAVAKDYGTMQLGVEAAKRYLGAAWSQAVPRAAGAAGGGLITPTDQTMPDFSSPDAALTSPVSGQGGMEFAETPQAVRDENAIPSAQEFKQAYFKAIMAGDTKAANMIKTAAEFLHADAESVTLSDSAITQITDLEAGIRGVDSLIGAIQQPGSQTGPISGQAAKIPWATGAKSLQAEIDRIRQKVGKALEGGVLRKEDEEKYKKILPTITDTEEVALNKLMMLKQELSTDLNNYVQLQSAHGKGTSQPAAARDLRFAETNPESFYSTPSDVDFSQLYP